MLDWIDSSILLYMRPLAEAKLKKIMSQDNRK